MLRRIFTPREKMALLIRALIVFVVGYYVAIFLVRLCVCIPISGFWNKDGRCVNLGVVFITDSFVSPITDGAILILPVILAWSLHLPLRKKIKVAAVLGAGGLATVTNVYRLVLSFIDWRTTNETAYTIRLIYTG
jgi:hypothetical protein